MSKRGLPPDLKKKKDVHYVEALLQQKAQKVVRMIPLDRIDPNPWQPRKDFGDLDELAQSIREHGVLEPILVRPNGSRFQIIAGERRYRASLKAGMKEIPALEIQADDRTMLEIALLENLQRKDLDPFEEADAYARLISEFNYTHAQLAKALGKSRSTISEVLSLRAIPEEVRAFCRKKHILSRKELLTIARQDSVLAMRLCVEEFAQEKKRKQASREKKEKPSPPRPYVFKDPLGRYEVRVRTYGKTPSKEEVRDILEDILDYLYAEEDS